MAEGVFGFYFFGNRMVRPSEKVFQSVKAFSVPNEDVVGMVEIAFRYGLIGGNQFLSKHRASNTRKDRP